MGIRLTPSQLFLFAFQKLEIPHVSGHSRNLSCSFFNGQLTEMRDGGVKNDRAKLIVERIKQVVGDAWKVTLENDNDNNLGRWRVYNCLVKEVFAWLRPRKKLQGKSLNISRTRQRGNDIMYELYVKQKMEEGLADIEAGHTIPHEELKTEILGNAD